MNSKKLISKLGQSKCVVSIYLRPETVVVGSKDDFIARRYMGWSRDYKSNDPYRNNH